MSAPKTNPTKTVLTITVGFMVIYLATEWEWAIIVALSVGLIGVVSTFLSKQIDFLWMKLSWVLSMIVPNIILSLIFFLFLFPIALLSKVFTKKDLLHLKNNRDSVFIENDKHFDKASFEKTF
jgi:hypothetical protein